MSTPVSFQHELDGWLAQATQGFSDETRQRIREEIEDHYLSGVSHYQARGKSEEEAHRSALAELGNRRDARRAFHDTYASKRNYMVVGFLSMGMPLLFAMLFRSEPEFLVGEVPFRANLIGLFDLLQLVLFALPALTIVYFGYGLLANRFHFSVGKWRIGVLVAGLLLTFLPSCVNAIRLIVTGHESFVAPYVRATSTTREAIGAAGIILFSAGLMLVSHHLGRLKYSLYGMQPALIVSAWIWGGCQVSLALVGLTNRTALLTFLLVLSSTAFCFFLGWMFIKAAFRGLPPLPIPGSGIWNG